MCFGFAVFDPLYCYQVKGTSILLQLSGKIILPVISHIKYDIATQLSPK